MTPYKIFGKEPALWLALCSAAIMTTSAFLFPLTTDQQGVLNAVCAAVFGLLTAWSLKSDGISAAVLGLLKAVIAVGIAFGLALSPEKQAIVMALATALTAMFVRTQETAPVSKAIPST